MPLHLHTLPKLSRHRSCHTPDATCHPRNILTHLQISVLIVSFNILLQLHHHLVRVICLLCMLLQPRQLILTRQNLFVVLDTGCSLILPLGVAPGLQNRLARPRAFLGAGEVL